MSSRGKDDNPARTVAARLVGKEIGKTIGDSETTKGESGQGDEMRKHGKKEQFETKIWGKTTGTSGMFNNVAYVEIAITLDELKTAWGRYCAWSRRYSTGSRGVIDEPTRHQVRIIHAEGHSIVNIAESLNISTRSVQRIIAEGKGRGE